MLRSDVADANNLPALLTFFLRLLDPRPGVAQSHRAVENQRVLLGIYTIDAEIPQSLELVQISALCVSERGLHSGSI